MELREYVVNLKMLRADLITAADSVAKLVITTQETEQRKRKATA